MHIIEKVARLNISHLNIKFKRLRKEQQIKNRVEKRIKIAKTNEIE